VANGLHADFSGFTVCTGTIAGALQEWIKFPGTRAQVRVPSPVGPVNILTFFCPHRRDNSIHEPQRFPTWRVGTDSKA